MGIHEEIERERQCIAESRPRPPIKPDSSRISSQSDDRASEEPKFKKVHVVVTPLDQLVQDFGEWVKLHKLARGRILLDINVKVEERWIDSGAGNSEPSRSDRDFYVKTETTRSTWISLDGRNGKAVLVNQLGWRDQAVRDWIIRFVARHDLEWDYPDTYVQKEYDELVPVPPKKKHRWWHGKFPNDPSGYYCANSECERYKNW